MDAEQPARIGLPPGMSPADLPVESGTHRVERAAPPAFFPAPPGVPVAAEPVGVPETVAAPEPVAAPEREPARWGIVLPGDASRPLGSAVLVGRNPAPHPDYPGAELVVLPDEGKSVSKTHAVITVDGDAAGVRDLASTNGTVVVRAGTTVPAQHPVALQPGDIIQFGSFRVTVTHG